MSWRTRRCTSSRRRVERLTEVALLEAIAAVRAGRTASLIQVVEALERLDADADPELAAHGRRLAKFYRQVAGRGTAAVRRRLRAGLLDRELRGR